MTVGSAGAVRTAAVRSKCAAEAEAAYAGDADLSYTCLIERIKDRFEIKERAAKGRLSKWAVEGVVRKGDSGSYRLTAGPI